MDKIDFKRLIESVGKEFQARIERVASYRHPTGIGDAREDAVREFLKEVLPPRFCIDRGKIFDSHGNLSKEFDVIVSESFDVSPIMRVAGRRIIPIEAVYGIIEIKSRLEKKEYNQFINNIIELDNMRRYYAPFSKKFSKDKMEELAKGFCPQDQKVGKIWSGIIAFSAPKGKTISKYLEFCCDGFGFICIPGREFVVKCFKPPGWVGAPYKLHSMSKAIWLIMDLVSRNLRPKFLMPNFSKYRESITNSIGDLPNAWRVKTEELKTPQ